MKDDEDIGALIRRMSGGEEKSLQVHEAPPLTDRTVRRDWDKARLLLGAMLKGVMSGSGAAMRPVA